MHPTGQAGVGRCGNELETDGPAHLVVPRTGSDWQACAPASRLSARAEPAARAPQQSILARDWFAARSRQGHRRVGVDTGQIDLHGEIAFELEGFIGATVDSTEGHRQAGLDVDI